MVILFGTLKHKPHTAYGGTFLVAAGCYSAGPSSIVWLSNNIPVDKKRNIASALQIGLGNLGGIVASCVYRAKDAPGFKFGHCMLLGFSGLGVVCTVITAANYYRINQKRIDILERQCFEDGDADSYEDQEFNERLGDKSVNYVYTI